MSLSTKTKRVLDDWQNCCFYVFSTKFCLVGYVWDFCLNSDNSDPYTSIISQKYQDHVKSDL